MSTDRFDHWRDAITRTRDCAVSSADADSFAGQLQRSVLGPAVLLGTSFPSASFRRTDRMVRRSDPELIHLTLLLSGTMTMRHHTDRTEVYGPGDLLLANSSHSYESLAIGTPGTGPAEPRVEGVGIDVPASLLPIPRRQWRDLLGRKTLGQNGAGALLAEFTRGLYRQAPGLRPAEASRLGTVVVDLVAAWMACELDAERMLSPDARHRALVENVRSFIRHNLHDPDLTPAVVAAAHHVSVSYLHRLFTPESQGETVAAFIRRQRLRKAHRELADPALRGLPVQVIAARCGIPRADDFARAFKSVYGLSPRDHRRQALSGPVGA
ncbi:AraC family transcriptional regulator [Streptomyces sp. FH025]|uniref:AraC family transcriptional regulator n=1 Tax=Streptomyces sp. FH025 TaxID=2815937 RepID=UPI001A9EADCF|nr:AraC family transcriptional regulator [Streptomyces sp. FH025]MBO1419626.1 AraC family transcriptional regulator [Streptomyces sp. FH025]